MKCLDKNINNPLRRDGTSQAQRQAAALVENYVQIDERSEEDLISYARHLALLFQYYDFKNIPTSDWTAFFNQQSMDDQPHYTLFKTFLNLFQNARDHSNTLTQKYLDYYYREVLQLDSKPATPDQVMVVVELAKNVSQHLIKEGIYLNAGKDKTDVERWYKTDEALVANKAKVADIKSIYHTYEEEVDMMQNINVVGQYFFKDENTSAQDYSSLDQEIKQIETIKVYKGECGSEEHKNPEILCDDDQGLISDFTQSVPPYWKPFGKNQIKEAEKDRIMETANLGFALSSPMLLLEAGTRIISWHIKFSSVPAGFTDLSEAELKSAFYISINGEKEWIDLSDYECRCSDYSGYLHFQIEIPSEVEPIRGYDKKVFTDPYDTEWPVLRMILKGNEYPHLYEILSQCQVSLNNLQVTVNGLKDLVVQNELSPLDPTKPFQPFGPQPEEGAAFMVGYPEAFQKPLKRLTFELQWDKLPNPSLYSHYIQYPWQIYNSSFRTDIDLLQNGNFNHRLKTQAFLFEYGDANLPKTISIPTTSMPTDFKRTLDKKSFSQFDHSLNTGFVRMNLRNIANVRNSTTINKLGLRLGGFGHQAYPRLYADALIQRANESSPDKVIPKEPYTPTLKSISMDYEAQLFFFGRNSKKEGVERFYHIHPFGVAEQYTDNQLTDKFPLIPNYPSNGYLYIGLEALKPSSILTLYFQIAEGTANPALDFEKEELSFAILVNNQWQALSTSQFLSDSSGGLQYTGIVKLNIPAEATTENTLLTSGLHWLQVSFPYKKGVPERAGWFPGILDLKTQALSATFEDRQNDPAHYDQALAAESISKLVVKDASVKKLLQPFSSIKGKPAESNENFFIRSSERLRHKNRSINIWDYERMVLEQFPSIYKVKCLNHSNDFSDIAPGEVYLIVISDIRNSNVGNPLQPLTSVRTMDQIVRFLKKYTSPFLSLDVANPIYEQVKVTFDVGFHPGFDEGFYKKELNKEIVQYLAPWAYDNGEDIIFGGKIYASSILAFIEKRPYVDYVTNFRMFHIYDSEGIGCMEVCLDFIVGGGIVEAEVDIAIAKTARSILTSAPMHCINPLSPGEYACSGSEALISE
ncbi:MAG: baseplate J/gp47 family protein [Bacteroidota bacterium]